MEKRIVGTLLKKKFPFDEMGVGDWFKAWGVHVRTAKVAANYRHFQTGEEYAFEKLTHDVCIVRRIK